MVCFKDYLLNLVGVPEEAFNEASDYLLVTALGTVFIFGYNALSAIMRGMGDSKSPLIFVTVSCGVNILLDLLFLLLGFVAVGVHLLDVFQGQTCHVL